MQSHPAVSASFEEILIMNDGYIISQMLINYQHRRPIIDILKERWEIANKESEYKTKPKWIR